MAETQRRKMRARRQKRVKKQLGRSERAQLTVYRSSKHIYAQLVDPFTGRTVTSVSTRSPSVRSGLKSSKDIEAAKKVGAEIARLAREKDISKVAFNRNGFVYTGRVRALADAAREAGLEF